MLDDKGSQFDGDGNLNNWWTEEDREIFEKRQNVLLINTHHMRLLQVIFLTESLL